MLEAHQDIQCLQKLHDLQKQATTTSERRSNADLAKFFANEIEDWGSTKPSVNISRRCVVINAKTKNEMGSIVKIQLSLNTDFQAACENLANRLLCYSNPIGETFTKSSVKPGEIRLDTNANNPAPIILWVYHNVFVYAELQDPDHDESMPSPKNGPSKSLQALTEKLFQYVRDGCVPTRDPVVLPGTWNTQTPDLVHVGETFNITMTVDRQYAYSVECDDNKIVYADFDIDELRYSFTFLAVEAGEASIHFNFALPDTFNFKSTDVKVRIDPTQDSTKAIS